MLKTVLATILKTIIDQLIADIITDPMNDNIHDHIDDIEGLKSLVSAICLLWIHGDPVVLSQN